MAGCSRSTARTRSCSTPPSARRWIGETSRLATTRSPDRATSRPWRPLGRSRSRGWRTRLSTSSTCRRRAALDEVRRAKAAGVRVSAETCPHYLVLTEERYDDPDPVSCACFVISPPLRSPADRDALWAGLADGSLDLVATDHVGGSPGRREGRGWQGRFLRPDQQRRTRHRDAARPRLQRGRRQGTDHTRADGRSAGDDPCPAVRSGEQRRRRSRARRRRRPVRPDRAPHHPRGRSPPHERLHAVRRTRIFPVLSAASSSEVSRSSMTVHSSGGEASEPSWSAPQSAPEARSPGMPSIGIAKRGQRGRLKSSINREGRPTGPRSRARPAYSSSE